MKTTYFYIPFFCKLAEELRSAIYRDMDELKHMQHTQVKDSFVERSFDKIKDLLIENCFKVVGKKISIHVVNIEGVIDTIAESPRPMLNFYINPISGINNFAKANINFAISFGIAAPNKQMVASMIYAPYTDTLFYAQKGKGSFVKDNNNIRKAIVSRRTNLNKEVPLSIACDKEMLLSHRKSLGKYEIYCVNCPILEIAMVAMGQFDGYKGKILELDARVSEIMLEEAGGRLLYLGKANDLGMVDVIAGNSSMLDELW